MKKSLILILLIFANHNLLPAQTYFNKDLKIMDFISSAGQVLNYGDTIFCVGYGTDFNPYSAYSHYLAKFDLDGNMIDRTIDTIGDLHYLHTNSAFIENERIITAADVVERDEDGKISFVGGYVLIMDIISGKTLKKIKFSTPLMDNDWQLVKGFTQIDSITYAVISSIEEDGQDYWIDSQISIVNIETDSVRYIRFGRYESNDIPQTIIWNGDRLLVGSHFSYPDFDPEFPFQKITDHTLIYEVDTSGNVREAFISDPMRNSAREILMDEEGNYVYLTAISNYTPKYYGNNEFDLHYQSIIVKLDSSFNLIWERPIGLKHDFSVFYGNLAKVIPSIEGDGYLTASYQSNFPWDISSEGKDSMRDEGIAPMTVGILHKFSHDGDSLWMRSYQVVDDVEIKHITHKIQDVTYAPDGGYVVFGTIHYDGRFGIDTVANYHAWLFKVDEYGCLVPGCQDTNSNTDYSIGELPVLVYPNPASNYLYVYQSENQKLDYRVFDLNGRLINSFSGSRSNETHILPIQDYPAGNYFIRVGSMDGKEGTKKFVKM